MKPRSLVLGGALLVTVALSVWAVVRPAEDVVAPLVQRAAQPSGGSIPRAEPANGNRPALPFEFAPGERPPAKASPRNLFAAYSYTPPPAPVIEAPPPPPSAPPLGLRYMGQLQMDGRTFYFLQEGNGPTQRLAVGDRYGAFQLTSDAGNKLSFLHVPTNLPVDLALPAAPN